MNINSEYRRCKHEWRRLTRNYFCVLDEVGRITYEYFGKGKNVQTWRNYTDLFDENGIDCYICHYKDSEGVEFYELYSVGREKVMVGKTVGELISGLKTEIELHSAYLKIIDATDHFLNEMEQQYQEIVKGASNETKRYRI